MWIDANCHSNSHSQCENEWYYSELHFKITSASKRVSFIFARCGRRIRPPGAYSDGGYIGIYTPQSVYLKCFMWLFCLLDPFIPTQIKFLPTPLKATLRKYAFDWWIHNAANAKFCLIKWSARNLYKDFSPRTRTRTRTNITEINSTPVPSASLQLMKRSSQAGASTEYVKACLWWSYYFAP